VPAPSKDEDFYREWCLAAGRQFCYACGVSGAEAAARWPGLSTHHVVKAGRAHEATNLIRLCDWCHGAAEGQPRRVLWQSRAARDRYLWPCLSLAHCLWLKREREPAEYDPARLAQLLLRPLPDPEPPPAVYRAAWALRRGRRADGAAALAASDFPGPPDALLTAWTP
jgi:hypothetical protein